MIQESFIPTIKRLKLNRKYVIYSILYGLSTLILPLAVQFLVNNLALAGIWVNILAFLIIIGTGLTLSLIIKYCQIVLIEFLQRELFCLFSSEWREKIHTYYRMYFIEIFFSMKSFSKSYTIIVETALVTGFGLVMIAIFHPVFLSLAILIVIVLYQIRQSTRPAIEASILVSDEKYSLFDRAIHDITPDTTGMERYLRAREKRFSYIKKNTIKLSVLYIICQILLLGGGTMLIENDQLSIGQLVSAEIIFSNIMISLNKLPYALEGMYDFETSLYKLEKARAHTDG
ncbi:MAG: hypothetical protein ACLGHN_01580 [Bacteriovoracia bacterium]